MQLRLPGTQSESSAANIMAKFCCYVYFFTSPTSGERWVAKNSGTFLCTLDDAFALAKRFNEHNFGTAVATVAG